MKSISSIITAFMVLSSTQATACWDNWGWQVCPKKRATVDQYSGEILGINRSTQMVSIRFDDGDIRSYNVLRITIGDGCIFDKAGGNYCVRARATVDSYSGEIVGVNPLTEKVSVRFDDGDTRTVDLQRVTVDSSCLEYPSQNYGHGPFSRRSR